MNTYKRQAKNFISEFNITEINSETLKKAIEECGYKIIRYRPHFNKDNIYALMEKLDVIEFATGEKAFTYADSKNRFVFLCEDLSEEESCILLSHEAGHVYLKHLNNKNALPGQDITNEYEANEFSHYLLKKSLFRKMYFNFKKNKSKYITAMIISAAILCSAIIFSNVFSPKKESYYYVTQNGEKYHRESCIYIKDKKNIKKYKIDELKEMGFSPCGVCNPDS